MAYQDFFEGFAQAQGVGSVDALLRDFADQYRFQITSRDRAETFIHKLLPPDYCSSESKWARVSRSP